MSLFTWADVEEEARRRGVDLASRSAADRRLLRTDPDRAMRAVDIWAGWSSASPEQQALDHQWMENWRRSAGYSGGADGLRYDTVSFGPDAGRDSAARDYGAAYERVYGAPDYSRTGTPPTRDTGAETLAAQQLAALLSYGPYQYDVTADPLYGQYRKQYVREGQRAGQEALAQAAALTGGELNSWAQTASSQARNVYAAQLADRVPELEERAWQRYNRGFEQLLQGYQAAGSAADRARQLWQTELGQYNADRDFDYGLYTDAYGRAKDRLSAAAALEALLYGREKDARSEELRRAEQLAALGDYSGYAALYGEEWAKRLQTLYDTIHN